MAMFVQSHLLRPLDVVLLRSPGLVSKEIKTLTFGPYSHAALVMSKTLRFESNDPGVFFSPAKFVHAYVDGGRIYLYDDVSKYVKYDVYRLPQVTAMDDNALAALQQRAVALTSKFNFMQYPPFEVFDKLIERHTGFDAATVQRLLRLKSRNENVIVAGPFCSQLVAEILQQLGLQVFDSGLASEVTSPNDFTREPGSRLRKQDGIVVDALPGTNDPVLLEFAKRMAGRLDREDAEFKYTSEKLQQDELLRRTLVDLVNDPTKRVDPAAVPEANDAIAQAFRCLQAIDENKAIDSVTREKRFFDLVNAGGDYLTALGADPLLEQPTPRPDYEEETNHCFAPMRKIIDRRAPHFYDRRNEVLD